MAEIQPVVLASLSKVRGSAEVGGGGCELIACCPLLMAMTQPEVQKCRGKEVQKVKVMVVVGSLHAALS